MTSIQNPASGFSADPLGLALGDYLKNPGKQELVLMLDGKPQTSQFVADFFALEPNSAMEETMLNACRGRKVLDIGAGAGRHSLLLQQRSFEVLAIDISQGAVEVMQARGVRRAQCVDWLGICEASAEMFDTVFLLNRGFGLAGTPEQLRKLLRATKQIVAPGGQIVGDGRRPPLRPEPTGALARLGRAFRASRSQESWRQREMLIRYDNVEGSLFRLLDISFEALCSIAEAEGWRPVLLADQSDSYAVSLQRTW